MNKQEVIELDLRICRAYGRKPADPVMIDQWHLALQNFTFDDAQAALLRWVKEGNPGPNLAQLVAATRAQQVPEGYVAQGDGRIANADRQRGLKATQALRGKLHASADPVEIAKLRSGKVKPDGRP